MSAALRAISRGAAALPLPAAMKLGRGLGFIFGSVMRYHRADAVEALSKSFPDWSSTAVRQTVNAMYAHLGRNIIECARLIKPSPDYLDEYIQWKGMEHLERALEAGKGAMLLTAHLGNWELLAALIPRVTGRPMKIIAKPVKGPGLQQYIEETRGRFGMEVLPAKGSYRECLRALKRNEIIGFVLDQNMIDREGVFVDFFDRPACTTPGLAHLSARTGAPVVPAFAYRLAGDRHVAEFQPALDPPPDAKEATLTAATAEYTRLIEDAIRVHPEQWIWLHRRWKTTPP